MDTGFIVLEHDLYPQAVDLAVDYVLPNALSNHDLSLMPIVDCLGQESSEAYVETAKNATDGVVPTEPITGATGTGMVTGLTYTPAAMGGGATGAGTTVGYTASDDDNKQKDSSNKGTGSGDTESSATAIAPLLSAALLSGALGSMALLS